MKKYYGYSESSNKAYWKNIYKDFKYPSFDEMQKNECVDRGNISVRYCAYSHKNKMISIIGEKINSTNWVKERVDVTENKTDIELSDKYKDTIVVRNARTDEILELIPIK